MKKIVTFLLAAVMLLSMTACKPSDTGAAKMDPDEMGMEMGQTYSDYEGVSVQISNASWDENGFVLKVDWINKTSYEGIFGASYIIERKEGEERVSCQTVDDLVFIALAYELAPRQTREETYDVSKMFDVSKAGTYRFRSDISIGEATDNSNKRTVWAEFTLSDDIDESQFNTQESVNYGVQYIRTDGYQDGAAFPRVEIIRSVEELNSYYEANKGTFDLERKDRVYSDTTIGFLDACDKYDAAYFEKGYLVFVLLEEGSGSIRHKVTGSTISSDGELGVYIDTITPEVGTDDMAEWHIIVELSRDVFVETTNDVFVYLNGNLAWNGNVVEPPKPEVAFKEPPEGTLFTPDGDVTLIPTDYNWTVENADGKATTTIADQASRPFPKDSLKPVTISSKHAETIYLPEPGSSEYVPTNALGYMVKFAWKANPSRITCTCWPDTVWQDSSIQGAIIPADLNGGPFYAKEGGYIYEFAVTWDDTGAGYHGTANYYVYIIGSTDHGHHLATESQTVDDPVTGYCGNTQTTLYINGEAFTFMYDESVTLTNILINLDYDPNKVCDCLPEYTVDTEFGKGYGINLTDGYARREKGQAELTAGQVDQIRAIIEWAKTNKPSK